MMRKNLNDPSDLNKMPSFLGRVFRIALYGTDDFDYSAIAEGDFIITIIIFFALLLFNIFFF